MPSMSTDFAGEKNYISCCWLLFVNLVVLLRVIHAANMATNKVDPYDFDNERGWRSYRVLRPGRGMYHDVKRRLPYYWSDITDAWTYRTFAGTVRIYFVKQVE